MARKRHTNKGIEKVTEFDFQIFWAGADTSDETFLDRLFEADCDDAIVYFKDGYLCLDFSRESESAESAVISSIKDIERSGIGGSIERVEPEDLASLSEIANRVGVTRSALQKYARGASKVGKDFPRPVQNIASPRRELFSTFEVMNWMLSKQRAKIQSHSVELFGVIAKTNQALIVTKAQIDDDVSRIIAKLSAVAPVEGKHV